VIISPPLFVFVSEDIFAPHLLESSFPLSVDHRQPTKNPRSTIRALSFPSFLELSVPFSPFIRAWILIAVGGESCFFDFAPEEA